MIGTSSRNVDYLHQLNVDQVIDYAVEPFELVARDVDVVLDTVGDVVQERSCMVLKPQGMLVSVIQAPSEELTARYNVRSAMVYSSPPIGQTLTQVAELVDSGRLVPHVSAVLPLQEVRQAHEMVEGRHTKGKLVLAVVP